jgi:hypothetical protein
MTIHVIPIPSAVDFGTPAQVYTTTNDPGSSSTALRTDSEIAIFDTTVASTLAFSGPATTGSQPFSSRRDHSHGMPANPDTIGLVLIGTDEATGGATLGVSGLSDLYDEYIVILSDVHPATDLVEGWLRLGDSGGIDTGNDDYTSHQQIANNESTGYGTAIIESAGSKMRNALSAGSNTTESLSGTYWLSRNINGTMNVKMQGVTNYLDGSGRTTGGMFIGTRINPIEVTQVQFLFSSGNIDSGRLSVFGYAHG